MKYTEIRQNIWQIADDDGVYCTLVKGDSLAVLWDTGYGKQDIRKFVEENVQTEYIVINSHGHPDHIGGNRQFENIYASEQALDEILYFAKTISSAPVRYNLKKLDIGQRLDFGGIHGRIISVAGHTKGSVGLLVEEERLILAGDALNPCLWMFNYGAASINQLKKTIENLEEAEFDNYICGHSDKEISREFLKTHLKNISTMSIENSVKGVTIGFETYESVCEDENGKSVIVYDEKFLTD